MSEALIETWMDLRDHPESTAAQMFDRMAPGPLITALYNRLEELMEYRLVKRRKVGRNWVYSLIAVEELQSGEMITPR